MTKLKLIICGITSALFLHGCNEILEPVTLFVSKQAVEDANIQEDFNINIKTLTFENARNANNTPYLRRIMNPGIGSKANVFDEADFLSSTNPPLSPAADYILGIGDKLLYTQLNEYSKLTTQFPDQPTEIDYLLGIGDELTLIQLNETMSGLSGIIAAGDAVNNGGDIIPQPEESILKTSGLIGSDGNILLLGLGSIKAENQSLKNIQTEVRNILIRNGLAPSFQLEITGFNSKKAFVTYPNPGNAFGNNIVPITNLKITLKELVINYGARSTSQSSTIVTLTREGKQFRINLDKLFDKSSPNIIIQDRDQIEIEEVDIVSTSSDIIVGSRGNILIPNLGSFKAEDRPLDELRIDINRALINKGLMPNFQLEITGFESKSFFIVAENFGSEKIPFTNSKLGLKEAVLSANLNHSKNSLTIVKLFRNEVSYQITMQDLLFGDASKVYIQDGDTIEIKDYEYKLGAVFALGGAGKAQMVPIDPSKRETLADILFTPSGALNNLLAKRSEVYLLRGRNPSVAYHLDAQNVSRILVAAQTELRPNDIVYVADRPIISFSRTLSEILPLRILLRDIRNDNIP
jgi:protein involved in polysaccharide export with SLBB domain